MASDPSTPARYTSPPMANQVRQRRGKAPNHRPNSATATASATSAEEPESDQRQRALGRVHGPAQHLRHLRMDTDDLFEGERCETDREQGPLEDERATPATSCDRDDAEHRTDREQRDGRIPRGDARLRIDVEPVGDRVDVLVLDDDELGDELADQAHDAEERDEPGQPSGQPSDREGEFEGLLCPTLCHLYRVRGNPRSTLLVPGSGQRDVTILARV